ncbi:MAG: 30S ribosomal protein S20 [Balneolaceae bacterium]
MPQHKSAIKRMRQNAKRRQVNREKRSRTRTMIKNVLAEQDKEKAESLLKETVSNLDRMSVKGIVTKKMASRKKAQLTKHVNSL